MMVQRTLLTAVAVVAAFLAAIGVAFTLRHAPAASSSRVLASQAPATSHVTAPKHSGPLVGVYIRAPLTSWQPELAFGAAAGVKVNLGLAYTNQGSGFPYRFAHGAYIHGAEAIIQIQPRNVSLQAIANGRYDTWVRTYASEVRAFGHPVIIGFGHEMNGSWYPWGRTHQPPKSFKAAWRHIVILFRQQGASNVTWLWTIHWDATAPALHSWWPGRSYVTWVGIDGYEETPSDNFSNHFASTIRAVRTFTKDPILLSESAVGPSTHHQARDIRQLFSGVKREHLMGLVWFDVTQNSGIHHQDWRLEGNRAALAAFRLGVQEMGKQG